MYRLTRCPCCETADLESTPTLVAPFIAEYVLERAIEPSALLECRSCGFRFFADRYDDREAARLYAEYRSPAYVRVRHRHEFWYSQRFNDDMGKSPDVLASRHAHLQRTLGPFLGSPPPRTVLDYGGDAGQMIPESLGSERFVFELSNVQPVTGVTKVVREGDLEPGKYDVVLLNHVLEHHSDPPSLVTRLCGLLSPQGLLYIEVPHERPWMGLSWRGRLQQAYLERLRTFPSLTRLVDFYSSAFRVKLNFVPPLGFLKLHEHINFFEPRSLSALVTRAGCSVLECRVVHPDGRGPGVVVCVAQRGSSPGA